MGLVSLEIRNLRVYKHTKIYPGPGLNLLVGANASGKTSVLEAIHLLAKGRSYRSQQIENIQRNGTDCLSVMGTLQAESAVNASTDIAFLYNEGTRRLTVNGFPQSKASAAAKVFPLQVISPDSHYEFRTSARERRNVLDWVLFHVEQDFPDLNIRYQRCLQQRNAALKEKSKNDLYVWGESLATAGEAIHAKRAQVLSPLQAYFRTISAELLGDAVEAELLLEPGWPEGSSLVQSLQQDAFRDRARGFTHSGPHRADLTIRLNSAGQPVDSSHGQYKVLVFALRLAQVRLFVESHRAPCCLLIDDLGAELDSQHRQRLSTQLSCLPIQVFITATDADLIDVAPWPSAQKFHVEQGKISDLVTGIPAR